MASINLVTGKNLKPSVSDVERFIADGKRNYARDFLKAIVQQNFDQYGSNLGLALSSGVDSNLILYTCLDLGIKPHIFSLTFQDELSRDFLKAQESAKKYGLEFHPAYLTRDPAKTISRIRRLGKTYPLVSKPDWEVAWAFSQLLEVAGKTIKGGCLMTGLASGDEYISVPRRAGVQAREGRMTRIHEWRHSSTTEWSPQNLYEQGESSRLGFFVDNTLMRMMVAGPLTGVPWHVANEHRRKDLYIQIYPDLYAENGTSTPSGMQSKGSGIREHLADVLLQSELNQWGCKTTKALYNRLAELWHGQSDEDDEDGVGMRSWIAGRSLEETYFLAFAQELYADHGGAPAYVDNKPEVEPFRSSHENTDGDLFADLTLTHSDDLVALHGMNLTDTLALMPGVRVSHKLRSDLRSKDPRPGDSLDAIFGNMTP